VDFAPVRKQVNAEELGATARRLLTFAVEELEQLVGK
jgi:hypothetical protein